MASDPSPILPRIAVLAVAIIAEDMQRMRTGMDRLSGVVGGAEQLPAVNPLGVIRQMIPSDERR